LCFLPKIKEIKKMKTWNEIISEVEQMLINNVITYTTSKFCDFYIPEVGLELHITGEPNKVEYWINETKYIIFNESELMKVIEQCRMEMSEEKEEYQETA
jgi:hypothetical protein